MWQFNYTLYIYDFDLKKFIIRYEANTLKLIQKEINEIMRDSYSSTTQKPRFIFKPVKVSEIIFKVLKNEN
jgi:hypothetical protein